jgi:uncharacterized protein YjeT (DUF2065 family)
MWDELLVATALILVFEGIMPFLSPASMREAMLRMSQMSDRSLRISGLISMLIGIGMLYFLK